MTNFEVRVLKLELLTSGVSISPDAWAQINANNKVPTTARTGLANGLEIILPNDVWVNGLVSEKSQMQIRYKSGWLRLYRKDDPICKIKLPSKPSWYGVKNSRGIPLNSIGQVRGDRLSITLYKDCTYFYSGEQCAFCAINFNPNSEVTLKDPVDICDVVRVALEGDCSPIDHIYFNLGNTEHNERGLPIYEELMLKLQSVTSLPTHLNQTAPNTVQYLHQLKQMGFTEISFNIEVFDETIAREIIPGKNREIGLAHHLSMLEAAVPIFGFGNVSSCLVVGLEPSPSALRGIEALMKRGVLPKLSVFRPLRGSRLRSIPPPSVEFLSTLWSRAEDLAEKYGVPLGPTCGPCKMLSLA